MQKGRVYNKTSFYIDQIATELEIPADTLLVIPGLATTLIRSVTMENRPRSILTLAALVIGVGLASQGLQTLANSRLAGSVRSTAQQNDIYMMSSITCPYCNQARAWFSENKIPFRECFIERDEACASQYQALMAPGTPTLVVRGKKLVGFNPRAIQAAFD